jgi:hypothetical protein
VELSSADSTHLAQPRLVAHTCTRSRHSLYKYFTDRKWAEAFLDGELRFRSLSYFRDYEDENVRGDEKEGTAVFRPTDGLIINNLTQGRTMTLPNHSFESTASQEEILVYCLSRSLTDELRRRFNAVACVEVLKTRPFFARVEVALPSDAVFPGMPSHTRIGHRVEYYDEAEGGNARWALPDVIAISKANRYSWQDEYRLVFSLTDALGFEKVTTRLVRDNVVAAPKPAEHHYCDMKARGLRDICRLHEF